MSYRPQEFWEERLREHFDLRGTGETGLSLAYNRACYDLRRRVLDRALREAGFDPRGREVLDVGCGTGFFTAYYLSRGARLTGVDIAPVSVKRLEERYPEARFVLSDVSEVALEGRFDLVNAFDVLYHITDDARWEQAVRNLAAAVAPGGLLLLTDVFTGDARFESHNVGRSFERYRALVTGAGLTVLKRYPTHVLLNRELGVWRFLNRAPGLLWCVDAALLALGAGDSPGANRLLVAKRPG